MHTSIPYTHSYSSTNRGQGIVAVNGVGVFLDFMWVADAALLNQVTANRTMFLL